MTYVKCVIMELAGLKENGVMCLLLATVPVNLNNLSLLHSCLLTTRPGTQL